MSTINSWDLNVLLKLNHFFANHGGVINRILAEDLIYTLPIILLILWFLPKENAKKAALRASVSVILAWPILAGIIGRLVNRPRPFGTAGVHELVFHRPDYSFPSDHATALFAVATSFYLSGYKKLSYLMFVIAIVVSFFRVATGLHFPSDVIAGAILGAISAGIIYILDSYLDVVYDFIINIAHKLHLA